MNRKNNKIGQLPEFSWYNEQETELLLAKIRQRRKISTDYHLIDDDVKLTEFLKNAGSWQVIALDTETDGLNWRNSKPLLLQILSNTRPNKAGLIVLSKLGNLEPLKRLLSNPTLVKIGQNLKFEIIMLGNLGIDLKPPLIDIMLGFKILNSGIQPQSNLGYIAKTLCNIYLPKQERVSNWGGNLTQTQLQYAANDVGVLFPIYLELHRKLQQEKLEAVAFSEYEALYPLAIMERTGLKVDLKVLEREKSLYQLQKDRLERQLKDTVGLAVNLDSSKQMLQYFQSQGYEIQSTSIEALMPYLKKPLVQQYLEYRSTTKLLGNHLHTIPKQLDADGRVRGDWTQIGTNTGRTSCCNPNLANISRNSGIRSCFVAETGYKIIKADYSQIELRLMAKVAGVSRLIEAYINSADVHSMTAKAIFHRSEVTKEERRLGKIINFGLIYGMGKQKFALTLAKKYRIYLDDSEIDEIYHQFFEVLYPEIKAHHQLRLKQKQQGYKQAIALDGRRFCWAKSPELTKLINYPIQSSCSSITKTAIGNWYRNKGNLDAEMILTKYDEIVVEAKDCLVVEAAAILRRVMVASGQKLLDPIPCVVDIEVGDSWGN